MNYHTQLNPFMCGICEQTFPREQNLKSHVRNVHSAEPKAYSCDACGKWCKQKLSVHKQRCPGKNGWECALCKKLFATKSGLLALCSLILRRNHTNAIIVAPHLKEKMDLKPICFLILQRNHTNAIIVAPHLKEKMVLEPICFLVLRRNHTSAIIVVPHLKEKMDYNVTKENTKTNQLFRTWTWTRNT